MERCLTPEEKKEKKAAIKYLREELKERLGYLNGEPDNLCKAYQAIIDSMQHQLEVRDINFFSDLTPEERDTVIEAYKNNAFNGHGWY